MKELTKRLFAEGWTEDHYPDHVFWGFFQGFRYEVENIRIEKKESRDLLQDLRDVAEGMTVVHASDLKKAAVKAKKDRRAKRREEKEAKIKHMLRGTRKKNDPPPEPEQLSLF